MDFYLLCRECAGVGRIKGAGCELCDGYGGFWVLLGPGIRIRLIPGDRNEKTEEPP